MAKKSVKEKKGIYDNLFLKQKNAWEQLDEKETKKVFEFGEEYKDFLNNNITERKIVEFVEKEAKKRGFVDIEKATKNSKKVYAKNFKKNIVLFDFGKGKMKDGFRLIGAHIDSLRLDLKIKPLYESEQFVMFNLHYYGGIKKYHWLNIPMTLQGVIINKEGKEIKVSIGANENEPVFTIPDLMPHLEGREEKKVSDIIKGEDLDAIAGSIPVKDKKTKEKIKANILSLLNKKYGIKEEDFVSADLGLYPATKARDVGLDRGIVGGAAHDDRAGSFTAIKAIFDAKSNLPKMVVLVDKEEIGNVGNTSMNSYFLENTIDKLAKIRGEKTGGREVLEKSLAISADTGSALDPKFADKSDPHTTNKLGYGVAFEKGTGAGGKYYGSEAHAEYVHFMRRLMEKGKVPWQYGTIGKVDQGGGGTIAYILAKYNMNIIDAGTPALGVHSPFELISKVDLYCAYKAFKVFFEIK